MGEVDIISVQANGTVDFGVMRTNDTHGFLYDNLPANWVCVFHNVTSISNKKCNLPSKDEYSVAASKVTTASHVTVKFSANYGYSSAATLSISILFVILSVIML